MSSILFHFLLNIACHTVWSNKITLDIYAISNFGNGTGSDVTIAGAEWIAAQEINRDTKLLNEFKFNIQVLDAAENLEVAVIHAIQTTALPNSMQNETYFFPIILGCPWSSLSAAVAPILNAFDIGLISASSTSISLSDTTRYPYFYRTVPPDSLQSQGLILLCQTFNWTRIGVVYVNDAYGLNLALGIQELAKLHNIDVTSIAISDSHDSTFGTAAKQIKDLKIYIVIIIVHTTKFGLLQEFNNNGIMQYPYYYLGVDGWFDENEIQSVNATQNTRGFLATIPFRPNSNIDLNIFNADPNQRDIVNASIHKMEKILKLWQYYRDEAHVQGLHLKPLNQTNAKTTFMSYGYDVVYTIAYAIQELLDSNTLDDFIALLNGNDELILILNEIITNKIDFNGVSGHVSFDENGDRMDGLYSYVNAKQDGSIEIVGYFYHNSDGEVVSEINMEMIYFPHYFNEKGIIPQSQTLIQTEKVSIDGVVSTIGFVFAVVSLIFVLCLAMLWIYYGYQSNVVIKAASWKLNCVMCIGAMCGSVCVIISGIDEALASVSTLNVLCNIKLWLFTVSWTILFMPLFMKTYRLSRVFNIMLSTQARANISDKKLFIAVGFCVAVDIVLLSIFTSITPQRRLYKFGSVEIIDELQKIQYLHGRCSFNINMSMLYYAILVLWKVCEIIFGLHVTLIVSRIKDVTRLLGRFDETGIQLLSVYLTLIMICITAPIYIILLFFVTLNTPNLYYLLMTSTIIFASNVVVSLNLLPRMIAVYQGNEAKYEESAIRKIEKQITKAKLTVPPLTYDKGTNTHFMMNGDDNQAQIEILKGMETEINYDDTIS